MEPVKNTLYDLLSEKQKQECSSPTCLVDVSSLKLKLTKVENENKLHITTISRDQIALKLAEYEHILKKFNGNVQFRVSLEVSSNEQGEDVGFDFFLTPYSVTPPMSEEEKEIHRVAELKRKMYRAKKKVDRRNRNKYSAE